MPILSRAERIIKAKETGDAYGSPPLSRLEEALMGLPSSGANEEDISGIKQSVNEIDKRVTNVESNLQDVDSRVGEIEDDTTIKNVQADVSSIGNDVAELKRTSGSFDERIEANEEKIGSLGTLSLTLSDSVQSIRSDISDIELQQNDTSSKVAVIKEGQEATDKNIQSISDKVVQVEQNIYTKPEIDEKVGALTANIKTVSGAVESINTDVKKLNTHALLDSSY